MSRKPLNPAAPMPTTPRSEDAGDWVPLLAELDAWGDAGRMATLWLRDDDAHRDDPQLRALRSLSEEFSVPMVLATVPDWLGRDGRAIPEFWPLADVVLHGRAHINHEPAGVKSSELGTARPLDVRCGDLRASFARLKNFVPDAHPILVPPWNRIGDDLVAELPNLGLRGLSTFRARTAREPVAGVVQVNTHADIINWRDGRRFHGTRAVIEEFTTHLTARRTGTVDPDEPTGVLTHHLDHDEDCWRFLRQLFELTAQHPNVRWYPASDVFA